jgi:hypothetical protein
LPECQFPLVILTHANVLPNVRIKKYRSRTT